jgi:hypothetical protein
MEAQAPSSVRTDSGEKSEPATRAGAERTGGAAVSRLFASSAWLRAAREIAIVTLGILIAFALNAWWEEHRERRQEQQHLRALASDFEQNVKRLVFLVEKQERVARRTFSLLEAARAPQPGTPESIRSLVQEVFSSQRFEPVMGAYEALVNSTGLTLIRDDELRSALADFAALVNGRYAERFADELYFQLVQTFAGRLQFADMLAAPQATPASYAELLQDPKFQEYLAWRHLLEQQVGDHYRGLHQRAEHILEQLEAGVH